MANELWLKRHIEKCTVTRVLILVSRRRRFGNGMAWNTEQTNKQTNKTEYLNSGIFLLKSFL